MRVGDAIRRGAAGRTQVFGRDLDIDAPGSTACARHAAKLGVGCPKEAFVDLFPEFGRTTVVCPGLECNYTVEAWYLVIHLNDFHRWSFEQIAAWADSVDDELEPR